jgi:hypothetical protein
MTAIRPDMAGAEVMGDGADLVEAEAATRGAAAMPAADAAIVEAQHQWSRGDGIVLSPEKR